MTTTPARTIPEWKLEEGLFIREDEQLPSVRAMPELGQIKLWDPTDNGGGWAPYAGTYTRMRQAGNSRHSFLGVDCINPMLAKADEFPEEWKRFRIQLWGNVFRDEKHLAIVKYLCFCEGNGIWMVRNCQFLISGANSPLSKLVETFQNNAGVRIAFVRDE